jgi:hypothetical protein
MISEQAKTGFDHIFTKAVQVNIALSDEDDCEIISVDNLEEINEVEFVVITISSTYFKLLILFHFNSNDEDIKKYFVKNSDLEEADNSLFRDAFQESCTICCGAMNRDLHKNYHFLGMSTPYVLLGECSPFISALNPGYINHYKITINHSLVLHATLCVCDFDVVDFEVDASKNQDDDTGELELF